MWECHENDGAMTRGPRAPIHQLDAARDTISTIACRKSQGSRKRLKEHFGGEFVRFFFCATELRVQFRFPLKPLCWSILLGKTRVSSLDFTEIHWSYLCDIQKESENPKIVSSLSREVPLFDSWSPWMPHPRLPTHHPSSGWRKRQLQSGAPVR